MWLNWSYTVVSVPVFFLKQFSIFPVSHPNCTMRQPSIIPPLSLEAYTQALGLGFAPAAALCNTAGQVQTVKCTHAPHCTAEKHLHTLGSPTHTCKAFLLCCVSTEFLPGLISLPSHLLSIHFLTARVVRELRTSLRDTHSWMRIFCKTTSNPCDYNKGIKPEWSQRGSKGNRDA